MGSKLRYKSIFDAITSNKKVAASMQREANRKLTERREAMSKAKSKTTKRIKPKVPEVSYVLKMPEMEAKQEPEKLASPWRPYSALNQPGLYVTRNGEGFDVARVQKIEDGLRVFYNVIGANRPQNLHADLVANSMYQKIAE